MKLFPASGPNRLEARYRNVPIHDKRPNLLSRLLAGWTRWWRNRATWLPPSASPQDPFAWSPARIQPKPKRSGGAVAVAEPDDE